MIKEPPENSDEDYYFFGFMDCLVELWQDLKDQGYRFENNKIVKPNGEVINRHIAPKYIPYRIKDKK